MNSKNDNTLIKFWVKNKKELTKNLLFPKMPKVSPFPCKGEKNFHLLLRSMFSILHFPFSIFYSFLLVFLIFSCHPAPQSQSEQPYPEASNGPAITDSLVLAEITCEKIKDNDTPALVYDSPEAVGIDSKYLEKIDERVASYIKRRIFPGCQVLVAKDGKIIYNKAFGHHTYEKEYGVSIKDVYDVASITKAAATALAGMKLYEWGDFQINDPIGLHLECPKRKRVGRSTIRQLFTHTSGIQANLPLSRYFFKTPKRKETPYFRETADELYSLEVADGIFFNSDYREELLDEICDMRVRRRGYVYSDVNYILLQRLIENKSYQSLDKLVEKEFYQPMGLELIGFNPLKNRERQHIIPTVYDKRWRKQLVNGYVHDESAALLGGVSGNAGLFSNTENLAAIFQMLLNGGQYDGKTYLQAATIEAFIRKKGRMSLGFSKPLGRSRPPMAYAASQETFGHTGFTGCCVWADPQHDLIFIFLSNSVHPDPKRKKLQKYKVRQKLHQLVYRALDTYRNISS